MVGSTRSRKLVARLRELGWGRVFVGKPTPYPGEPWALDNGAFAAWKSGKKFSAPDFAKHAHAVASLRPIFGVLPDVVGGGEESIKLSASWIYSLPESIPWYLAVQDGMTEKMVGPVLEHVSGIFLGGTTEFKSTAPRWSELAHGSGKRFHYARVSTPQHIRRAYDCGADSCDSTQPLWSENEWRKFERAVADTRAQTTMFDGRINAPPKP